MVGSQILQFPIRLMSSPAALLETAPWLLVPLLAYALLAFAAGILISTAVSFAAVVQTYALKERSDAPLQQSS
jgi:formate/nitrite transporter FocA (FNT family)